MGATQGFRISDPPITRVRPFYSAIYRIIARFHDRYGLAVVPWHGPQGDWCFGFILESLLCSNRFSRPDENLVTEPELLCSQRGFIYRRDGSPLLPEFEPGSAKVGDYEQWVIEKLELRRFFAKHAAEINRWHHPPPPLTEEARRSEASTAYLHSLDKEHGRRGYPTQLQAVLALGLPVTRAIEGKDPPACNGAWKSNENLYWRPWEDRIYAPKFPRECKTGHLPVKAIVFLAKRLYEGAEEPLRDQKGWVSIFWTGDGIEGWSTSLERLPDGRYILLSGSKSTMISPWEEDISFMGTAREMRRHLDKIQYCGLGKEILRKIV